MRNILLALGLSLAMTMSAATPLTSRIDSLVNARYGITDTCDGSIAPGAAIIIARGDSVIYERYLGIADMETREPVTADTRFNIASVSKQFTVAAILQQRALGHLDVNHTLERYVPYTDPLWSTVTIADLCGHTSGIADTRDRSDRRRCIYANDSTSIAYFPNVHSLRFKPGTAYDYLNPSFLILARIVERLSGQPFTEYVRDRIFRPAGMNAIYFDPDTMPAHTAHAYMHAADDSTRWEEFDYGEETFFATRPDGGIYATARDMLAWEKALADGKVLSPALRDLAYTPRVSVADSPWCDYQRYPGIWYGLGWFIDTTPGRPRRVYHTGDNGGFQAYVAKYPDTGFRVIVLENRHDQPRRPFTLALDACLEQ